MIDLHTIVWGPMVENYLTVTLPSLLSRRNLPAARNMVGIYTIYAPDEVIQRIVEHPLYRRLFDLVPVEFERFRDKNANRYLIAQMRKVAENGHHMLGVGPDSAIGDGSILRMAELSREPVVLFNKGPKVDRGALREAERYLAKYQYIPRRKLVEIATRHLLPASYIVKQTGKHSWQVVRRSYSPCFIPDRSIIRFYAGNRTLTAGYDQALPWWLVRHNYPYRIISDSDDYFVIEAELSSDQSRLVPWHPEMTKPVQEFFANFKSVWRSK